MTKMVSDLATCDWSWMTLKRIKESIDVYIMRYGEDAELSIEDDYGSPSLYFNYSRPETDAEKQRRLYQEQAREEYQRKQYEELKKKYEGERKDA